MLRIIVVRVVEWLPFDDFIRMNKQSPNDNYVRMAKEIEKACHVYNMKKQFTSTGHAACTFHFFENEQGQLLDMLEIYHEIRPSTLDFYGLTIFQPYENFVLVVEKPSS